MFKVFGTLPDKERVKWKQKHPVNNNETEEDYEHRCQMAVNGMQGKCLAEFDIESTAIEFIERVKQLGYTNLTIKIEKLYRPGDKKRPISRTHVDIKELPLIDAGEQALLRVQI